MMSAKEIVSASKFLSLILRHKPEEIGITLTPDGWAPVAEIVAKSNGKLTEQLITRIVLENDKQRFAMSADGTMIRASQGHSVSVELGLAPSDPPDVLFHGTATRFLAAILNEGLKSGSRQHVHLSSNRDTARKVGQRHGSPTVLTVAAGQMAAAGHLFWISENGVWLTNHVPPSFIRAED